jgi:hypothetical protein
VSLPQASNQSNLKIKISKIFMNNIPMETNMLDKRNQDKSMDKENTYLKIAVIMKEAGEII